MEGEGTLVLLSQTGDQSREIKLEAELKDPLLGDNLVSEKNELFQLDVLILP